jgi:hypothetical protein
MVAATLENEISARIAQLKAINGATHPRSQRFWSATILFGYLRSHEGQCLPAQRNGLFTNRVPN